jgi:hypothetical protein
MPLFPGIVFEFQLGYQAGRKNYAKWQQKNSHRFPGIHPVVFPEFGRHIDFFKVTALYQFD